MEPLPGYKLVERIGAGGYGEVWRATAPGGLDKAIKFVFGTEHEKRATIERKSMERIKELRHPFLLSLERIEVIDGRLLVVTELADSSLKDHFDKCRKKGLSGIPRDELIGYLRDAADALDFMCQSHSLQHLDIKSENLLLVANHIKVADFGLVKDVQQSQASIVGGMTPLYSAPEVFRGQPSTSSDQYSLAILYQEMLTGSLPFCGETSAELTLQHLNEEPALKFLHVGERFVVSRALSKNPEHRYANCREFCEALASADVSGQNATAGRSPDSSVPQYSAAPVSQKVRSTQVFDEEETPLPESFFVEFAAQDTTEAKSLDAVDFDPNLFEPCPTLYLGIGRSGGQVVAQLQQALRERFGSSNEIPTHRFLVIDSDPKAISQLTHTEGQGLTAEETIAVPLRRPQHYRDSSTELLKWLSRRWLYNIPKSLRTDGLRPLGRLALVDHARQVCQRIRQSLALATGAESLATSSKTLGQTITANKCRVYIAASLSGGTGSGMVLDAAYAVRAALKKLEIEDVEIIGILMHSTGRDRQVSELASVNAYSCLNELQHFLRPEVAYPGDQSCGLPAHATGVPPFEHTYFLHLGDGLNSDDFENATSDIADYLVLDSLTPANSFFEACRKIESPTPQASIRSFGVSRISSASPGLADALVGDVCLEVLSRWIGSNDTVTTAEGSGSFEGSFEGDDNAPKVQFSKLASECRKIVGRSLDGTEDNFLQQFASIYQGEGEPPQSLEVHQAVDRLFRRPQDSHETDGTLLIQGRTLADIVGPLQTELRQCLDRWLYGLLNDCNARLSGSRHASQWLRDVLDDTTKQASKFARQLQERIMSMRSEAIAPLTQDDLEQESIAPADPMQEAQAYLEARLDHCGLIAVKHVCKSLQADVTTYLDRLTLLDRELKQMASIWQDEANAVTTTTGESSQLASDSFDHVRSQIPTMSCSIDQQVQQAFFDKHDGMETVLMQGGRLRAQLAALLRDSAHQAIQTELSNINLLDELLDEENNTSLRQQVDLATPHLQKQGGESRLLAATPPGSQSDELKDRLVNLFGATVATVPSSGNSFSVCVETGNISLASVAMDLIQRRRDYIDFSDRVRTRSDIEWSKIADCFDGPTKDDSPAKMANQTAQLPTGDTPSTINPTQLVS